MAAQSRRAHSPDNPFAVDALLERCAVWSALPCIVRARRASRSSGGSYQRSGRSSSSSRRGSNRTSSGRCRSAGRGRANESLRAARTIIVKLVDQLIDNLPCNLNVSGITRLRRQLLGDGVTEIQSRGTIGRPSSRRRRPRSATFTSITNKEWQIRRHTVHRDNNPLAAVCSHIFDKLCVVHSNQVVGVDILQGPDLSQTAFDLAQVGTGEVGVALVGVGNVVVVGSESTAAVDFVLGEGGGKEQTSCCEDLVLHFGG